MAAVELLGAPASRWRPPEAPIEDSLHRKLGAIVEMFKVAIRVAYPRGLRETPVRSLADLCAAVLGTQIESSVAEWREEEENSDNEEEDETELVDHVYEEIPEHLRRWVLIPHAIEIIHRNMPIPVPLIWSDILEICLEKGSKNDAMLALSYALSNLFSMHSAKKPSAKMESDLSCLSRVCASKARFAWSESDFVHALISALGSSPAELWCLSIVDYYFNEVLDPFLTLGLFDAMVTRQDVKRCDTRQIQRWCSRIMAVDFALPPDEDFEYAESWVHGLQTSSIRLLELCQLLSSGILSHISICFSTHSLARSERHAAQPLVNKMLNVFRGCDPDTLYYEPLFQALDPTYFYEGVLEYDEVLGQYPTLLELRILFLKNLLAFTEQFKEPTDNDPDPEPLLDDFQTDKMASRLSAACSRWKKSSERHSVPATPRKRVYVLVPPSPIRHDKKRRRNEISTTSSQELSPSKALPKKQRMSESVALSRSVASNNTFNSTNTSLPSPSPSIPWKEKLRSISRNPPSEPRKRYATRHRRKTPSALEAVSNTFEDDRRVVSRPVDRSAALCRSKRKGRKSDTSLSSEPDPLDLFATSPW